MLHSEYEHNALEAALDSARPSLSRASRLSAPDLGQLYAEYWTKEDLGHMVKRDRMGELCANGLNNSRFGS